MDALRDFGPAYVAEWDGMSVLAVTVVMITIMIHDRMPSMQ